MRAARRWNSVLADVVHLMLRCAAESRTVRAREEPIGKRKKATEEGDLERALLQVLEAVR